MCGNDVRSWDVMTWRRFPHHWPIVRGINRWPADSPHKRSAMWSFGVFLAVPRSEQFVEQTVDLLISWYALTLMWRHSSDGNIKCQNCEWHTDRYSGFRAFPTRFRRTYMIKIEWKMGQYQGMKQMHRQTANIKPTLAANKIVNHSDVVGASSPVGAAPTTSSFST